ncbi:MULTISPECIES: OmpA family protein [Roseomonadaceae]|uniref:OmpA family protein n=1 Tax=Falsiroseomonas oleicola TaxID=2801474 RepID=A0ABS6HBM7_9PROT|nr:OmpA family protein [Roseomonas oleicola]MBU8544886.1 OmpA family protein [Roseomonas oleicola]
MTRRIHLATLLLLFALPAQADQTLSARPQGGWRIGFAPGQAALTEPGRAALARLAPQLAATPHGRITVEAQASGPADDASAARRIALARAGTVRDALVAAGLEATRIDIRALGLLTPPADAADILPPGVARSGTTR